MAQNINVHCNPFVMLDHNGMPCGVFPFDPDHAGGSRRWIGASVNTDATKDRTTSEARRVPPAAPVRVTDGKRTIIEDVIARTRTVFAFDLAPQPIPSPPSKHYRDGVRDGSLFPADAASAKALGIPAKDFVVPTVALAKAHADAVAHWLAGHDEPAPVELWAANLQAVATGPVEQVPTDEATTPRNALQKITAAEPAKDDAK